MTDKPRWIRDLRRFLPLRSQFLLTGNIRDRYPVSVAEGPSMLLPLVEYLTHEIAEAGLVRTIAFDPVAGFYIPQSLLRDNSADTDFFASLGIKFDEAGRAHVSMERFFEILPALVTTPSEPVVVIADFASRLIQRPDHLVEAEHRGFTSALVLAHQAEPRPHPHTGHACFNPIIWIADKEGDLPDWFTVDNPRLRQIAIPRPDHELRRGVAATMLAAAPGGAGISAEDGDRLSRRFAEATDGLRLVDLDGVAEIMRTEALQVGELDEAIRRYKLGVTEDPWRKIDRARLQGAEGFIRERVKGQDKAVRHMLDIVMRAATGIGGERGGRPRGVAFLAGPTGVGKTELAKTVTQLLFGDERAYIRFDMSEFSAEHADQRLIGAPPGYVGYDTGGELTNAIKERPFSVVLFDEIEKAHPRILDKFLQVLDDGVLTSGRGERVYFSESLILFTSNLGMSAVREDGTRRVNVTAEESYESMSAKVRAKIERHFKLEIGRPELLNRIGENIIIFDFIRPALAREIFDTLMQRVLDDIARDLSLAIRIEPEALERLRAHCLSDLSNGGRGIRNAIEVAFVNPLARAVFEAGVTAGTEVTVSSFQMDAAGARLEVE